MNHTPIKQGDLLTCADCAWRVVLTNRGPFVRDEGETEIDHMQLLHAQQALVERQIKRLIWLYQESAPIPFDGMDEAWRPSPPLTMRQVRQYGRYIKAEHGL